jgi:protein tyrosine phosphatase type 4A
MPIDAGNQVEEKRIGIHCVAGLGRAPFLVAIALVNNGCSAANAIDLIRKNRPGALNLT